MPPACGPLVCETVDVESPVYPRLIKGLGSLLFAFCLDEEPPHHVEIGGKACSDPGASALMKTFPTRGCRTSAGVAKAGLLSRCTFKFDLRSARVPGVRVPGSPRTSTSVWKQGTR